MCLAKAYTTDAKDVAILEDISRIRVCDGSVELQTLFGIRKVVPGKIAEVDFCMSRILLQCDVMETASTPDQEE